MAQVRENGIQISFSCLGFLWYFKMDLNFPFRFSFIAWHWNTEFYFVFLRYCKKGIDFRFSFFCVDTFLLKKKKDLHFGFRFILSLWHQKTGCFVQLPLL